MKLTSTGEPYDMLAMTAASTSLPLPCYVRVTNLENNRSIVVRVNDRGPFVDNRIIDLSYAAAKKLRMTQKGTALVQVAIISPDMPNIHTPRFAQKPKLFLQMGAFSNELNAIHMQKEIQRITNSTVLVSRKSIHGKVLYAVKIGPLRDVPDTDHLKHKLEKSGYKNSYTIIG